MTDNFNKDILSVVKGRLCCSCGACEFICPVNAIKIEETKGGFLYPTINKDLCNKCGLCRKVCPSIKLNFVKEQRKDFKSSEGNVLDSFVGISTNNEIYQNSQSGGIVTSILLYLLENNKIDYAITTEMKSGNPPRAIPKISKNIDELLQSQKSKYSPIPINTLFKEIDQVDGKVAIVALPCQVHGIYNILEYKPYLRDKIKIIIGLVCDRVMTNYAIDFLIDYSDISSSNEMNLIYRDKTINGYPGDIRIQSKGNNDELLESKFRMYIKNYFTPPRCRICYDKMNSFSDIVVCDPHGIDDIDRRKGESVAIVRTQNGFEIFKSALNMKYIKCKKIDYNDIYNGQAMNLKREKWIGFSKAWNELGYDMPDFRLVIPYESDSKIITKKYKKILLKSIKYSNLDKKKIYLNARVIIYINLLKSIFDQIIHKKL